jgi:uncharacterized protein YdaU (DUF1376 family)
MGQIKWYKRDPQAALNGMLMLTLEERGAYNTVLDLLYANDGRLVDDDAFLAGWMRVDVRVWRRIKSRLIEAGKLTVSDGLLGNFRATSEILEALARAEVWSQLGRTKGYKSGDARRKIKDLSEPNDEPTVEPNANRGRDTTTTTTRRPSKEGLPDPSQKAFEMWNEMVSKTTGFSQAQVLSETRKVKLRLRVEELGGFDGWGAALAKVAASSYCRGDNDRGWIADLDFMLQQSSLIRLMEGKYDDRPKRNAKTTLADGFAILDEVVREAERRSSPGGVGGEETARQLPRLREGPT